MCSFYMLYDVNKKKKAPDGQGDDITSEICTTDGESDTRGTKSTEQPVDLVGQDFFLEEGGGGTKYI
ncbi:hypothetical protein EDL79_04695 [Ehrlichia ruminantium]|uniref:Uncharacterized protein n=2 Tax=Ehrlichia ruminantium TaxID=779 RepID=A0AAE6UIP4_EHRRU|nr:hypothetical protein EDL81_04680 [Ehrlichia ruminantium]QGR03824.1 hypothetical protein EDL80_04685 [Ehrlichia ruminantium]QGR04751.1 hypothetical protein EDL79_04695 [Ehrlichia ruminantium]